MTTQDPFQQALSQVLLELSGLGALSVTDRQGDQIATAYHEGAGPSTSPEELGLIQVYGQLASRGVERPLQEISMTRGERSWLSRAIEVDEDRYHLWAVWSGAESSARSLTQLEVSEGLKRLELTLRPLLRG